MKQSQNIIVLSYNVVCNFLSDKDFCFAFSFFDRGIVPGHRIVETMKHNDIKVVDCTRWEEIKECVNFHAQLATLVRAPTVFRVSNKIQFIIFIYTYIHFKTQLS